MIFASYLADIATTLYEVPVDTAAEINVIFVINTDSVARTVTFYVYRKISDTTVPITIAGYEIAAGQKLPILDQPTLRLETGDKITAIASVNNKIACVIDGKTFTKFRI
jgi:hypothetical protein